MDYSGLNSNLIVNSSMLFVTYLNLNFVLVIFVGNFFLVLVLLLLFINNGIIVFYLILMLMVVLNSVLISNLYIS